MCTAVENSVYEDGFSACEIPVSVNRARSILSLGVSDMLVLERGTQAVIRVFDTDGDDVPDTKQIIATAPSLNHGLAIHDGYIYASRDTEVYRWSFSDDDFSSIGYQETVVTNMNADGNGGAPQGHRTRTLIFDAQGRLYISVGSNGNVDRDSHRSRIRRFELNEANFPLDFQLGEVFADGLRNEVGLAFDRFGVLWGVENGADNLRREDLGGDITDDNPAEEVNRFKEEDAGKHWGYPYCWTEYGLDESVGLGRGTVWAWPSFLDAGAITDEECRANYVPPLVSMQAHSAPLGIAFYEFRDATDRPSDCKDVPAFPKEMDGYAFIAFHGSWNRDIPTGYKVIYIPIENGEVTGEPTDLLAHKPPNAKWEDGFRPVDVDFDSCGRLLVTSDGSGGRGAKLVRIEYSNAFPSPSVSPSFSPLESVTEIPTVTASRGPSFAPQVLLSEAPSEGTSTTEVPSSAPQGTLSDSPTVSASNQQSQSSIVDSSSRNVGSSHRNRSSFNGRIKSSPVLDIHCTCD